MKVNVLILFAVGYIIELTADHCLDADLSMLALKKNIDYYQEAIVPTRLNVSRLRNANK